MLEQTDKEILDIINLEKGRQRENLEMIASENFTSLAVMEAMGSILTNKYAEGYPGHRYYGGCQYVDMVEDLAIERAKKLFGAEHANVQPHSGSQANMAVYNALVEPGSTIMGMDLSHGGHLTHGSPVNFSGKTWNFIAYGVSKEDQRIDYDKLREAALEHKPKMIVAGASAYPRIIDFKRLGEIAKEAGALLFVDMAHIAGLVAAGLHPNPVPYADIVTTTTHKTLRGPRGGMILCRKEYAKAIDKAVFPGIQGGPLMHVIAAKAVALKEAMQPEFKTYCENIIANAQALAEELKKEEFNLVSGGTDNHLLLIDVRNKNLTGKEAEHILDTVHITVNKNTVPFETESPFVTSGIRLGTAALTTRGMGEKEMRIIGRVMALALTHPDDEIIIEDCNKQVAELCKNFPLYPELA